MDTKETWEEEFDEKFDFFDCAALNGVEIKSFIAEQIQKARDAGYAEGARRQAEMDAETIQKAKLEVIGAVEGYPTPQIGDKNGAWAEELKGFKMVLVYSLKSKYTK